MYYQSAEDLYKQMIVYITNVDTSENSYVRNSLFPSAMEIAYALMSLDEAEKKVFASTALASGYSSYLELRVAEMGITRKTATYANIQVTFTGKVGTTISAGSIVSTNDNRLYTTTTDVTIGTDGTATCYVLADKSGSLYNVNAGDICYLPVKYSGVTSVTNASSYSSAVNMETDADLYARYLRQIQNGGVRGNKTDYENLALSVTGVGSAVVYPLKDENLQDKNGCVTIVIANENNRACDQTLIDSVYDYISKNAPIGANLSILSVVEIPINISLTLTYNTSTYDLASMQSNIESALTSYLQGVALSTTSIKYNKILSIIMDTDGTIDVQNLTINGGISNISLNSTQVAVLGTITVS